MRREQALADAARALEAAFPDRWEEILTTLSAPDLTLTIDTDDERIPTGISRADGGDPRQKITVYTRTAGRIYRVVFDPIEPLHTERMRPCQWCGKADYRPEDAVTRAAPDGSQVYHYCSRACEEVQNFRPVSK